MTYQAYQKPMGRKKLFDEQIRLPLPEGKKDEIDRVLSEDEARLDFIRLAIDKEIASRKRKLKKTGA